MFNMGWWGRSSRKNATTEAIVQLRTHMETLVKREQAFEEKRDQQDRLARQLVTTNKAGARAALRRKKKYEEELEKVQGQLITLEQQLGAVESANLNRETMKVMQQGADAMRHINKGMDVDKLDQTMDDIRDQVALGDEISDAISRPLQEVDDNELEADLEQLEQEALDERMVGAGRAPASALPDLPAASTEKPAAQEEDQDEEEALRQLEAEMAA